MLWLSDLLSPDADLEGILWGWKVTFASSPFPHVCQLFILAAGGNGDVFFAQEPLGAAFFCEQASSLLRD